MDDLPWASFIMTASIGLIFTLIGVSIPWLPFNVLPGGDLALNRLSKPLLTRSQFVDLSFYLRFIWTLYVILSSLSSLALIFIYHYLLWMATMKENKERKLWTRGTGLKLNPKLVLLLGTRGRLCPRILTWEIFLVVEEKRLSMGHPKQELSSLASQRLNHPSKSLM